MGSLEAYTSFSTFQKDAYFSNGSTVTWAMAIPMEPI